MNLYLNKKLTIINKYSYILIIIALVEVIKEQFLIIHVYGM